MFKKMFGMVMLFSLSGNASALEFSLPLRCEGTDTDKIEKAVEEHTYLIKERMDPDWGSEVVLIQFGEEERELVKFSQKFDIKIDKASKLVLKNGYGSWFAIYIHSECSLWIS